MSWKSWIAFIAVGYGVVAGPAALAQEAAPAPQPVEPLPALPKLPDVPRSMLAPASPAGGNCACLPGPYFESDPLLDPPELPHPGFFAAVDLGADKIHVRNHLTETLPNGDLVHAEEAPLDWAFSPRIEAGYRLPSGFGDLSMVYRFVATDGNGSGFGPDGPAALHGRFDLDEIDWDYASREFSLWPHLDMKWRIGLRLDWVYWDALADQEPGAGGVFEQRTTNSYVGVGPHTGLELGRRFGHSGFSLIGKCDFAIELGHVRQGYFESSLAGGTESIHVSDGQGVPQAGLELGLRWQPPSYPGAELYAGYHYEYWWDVGRIGRLDLPPSRGDFSDQGFLVRLAYNF